MSIHHAQKLTDSQSKIHAAHRHVRSRHGALATGLMLLVTNALAADASASEREADGSCPWGAPVTPDGARRVFTFTGTVPATPDEVFPLLCPVLEYEWLDDWTCTMRWSGSGVAEKGCAFDTRIQLGESWICSRYEPPTAIQYVVWIKVGWMVLDLDLTDLGDGSTELHWQRTFTATRPMGRKVLGKMKDEQIVGQMQAINDQLVAYLQSR